MLSATAVRYRDKLSKPEQSVLDALVNLYNKAPGEPVMTTERQIAELVRVSHATVARALVALAKAGLLEHLPKESRDRSALRRAIARTRRVRHRRELRLEHHWDKEGSLPTLADCAAVFLFLREGYGVSHNRAMMELARIPAWAKFVDETPGNLCDYVSNPMSPEPLPRGRYRREDELALQDRIAATLGGSRRSEECE